MSLLFNEEVEVSKVRLFRESSKRHISSNCLEGHLPYRLTFPPLFWPPTEPSLPFADSPAPAPRDEMVVDESDCMQLSPRVLRERNGNSNDAHGASDGDCSDCYTH